MVHVCQRVCPLSMGIVAKLKYIEQGDGFGIIDADPFNNLCT